MDQGTKDNRSIGDLFAELTHETRQLVQQEIQLAKAEFSEKVDQVQKGAMSLSTGCFLTYAGFLGLMTAAIFGLALVVDLWLAALIVGVVVFVIGLSFIAKGREDLKSKHLNMNRTAETLQEDKKWLKAQMR